MNYQEFLDRNRETYLKDLVEFLRIPSVSAVSDSALEVIRAAKWTEERLIRAGLENVQRFPTGEHECVYADWLHAPGRPTILIYGHFDVQPADPLELWESPPFEPLQKDGRLFARGAADMKANVLLTIAAVEALLATENSLPVNVKFLFEGQEEIGSRDLEPFVSGHRNLLACDVVLTPDSMQWSETEPAILLSTKGLCGLQIDLETASLDLHSGLYGGAVPNAIHALVELLDSMRGEDGGIVVEGFYDHVRPLTRSERDSIAKVPFEEAQYFAGIGADVPVGESGYTTYERTWVRPTLEINGIWGGYQGDGVKTVLPAKAHAKITCRLVANQEPDQILQALENHIATHKPKGARISVSRFTGKARAYEMSANHAGVTLVADVLQGLYGKAPYYVRSGGTLPIMDMFLQELGAFTIPVGFALEDERMHSPNEFIRIANFERGQSAYAVILKRFAELEPAKLKESGKA